MDSLFSLLFKLVLASVLKTTTLMACLYLSQYATALGRLKHLKESQEKLGNNYFLVLYMSITSRWMHYPPLLRVNRHILLRIILLSQHPYCVPIKKYLSLHIFLSESLSKLLNLTFHNIPEWQHLPHYFLSLSNLNRRH